MVSRQIYGALTTAMWAPDFACPVRYRQELYVQRTESKKGLLPNKSASIRQRAATSGGLLSNPDPQEIIASGLRTMMAKLLSGVE